MTKKIVVVSGGLGVPSTSRLLGDSLAAAATKALAVRGTNAEVETVELREFAVDIANNMVTRYAAPRLEQVIQLVSGADALIVVSPVFTASVSGLFKSFFDVLDPKALEGKPLLLAATGGSSRHSLVLDYVMRPIFSYLRADIMPTGVFASPEDWGGNDDRGVLSERSRRAAGELAAAVAAGTVPVVDSPPERAADAEAPKAGPTTGGEPLTSLPFEELLANIGRN